MHTSHPQLSVWRTQKLQAQGYARYSSRELAELAFGIRFAYVLCTTFLAVGVAMAHIPTLIAMNCIAFATVLLPNHPFDYIYNLFLRHLLDKPELPPRSRQLKFACSIATLWILATTFLFYTGFNLAGYVVGGMLLSVATLVSTTDYCIPSMIYNYFVGDDNAVPKASCLR